MIELNTRNRGHEIIENEDSLSYATPSSSNLQGQYQHLRSCLDELQKAFIAKRREVAELRQQLSEERARYITLQESYNEGSSQESLSFKSQLETLEKQNRDLEANNISLFDSYKGIKKQLDYVREQYESEIESLNREIITLTERKDKIATQSKEKAAEYQESLVQLQDELNSAKSSSRSEIEKLAQEKQEQVAFLKTEMTSKTNEIMFLSDKVQDLEFQYEALESHHRVLQQNLNEKNEQIRELETELNRSNSVKSELEYKLQESRKTIETSLERQKRANEIVKDFSEEIEVLNRQNAESTSKVSYLEQQVDELLEKVEESEERRQRDHKLILTLQSKIRELEQTKKEALEQNVTYKEESERIKKKCEGFEKQLETRDQQYRFYLDNLNKSKKELREQGQRMIIELKATKSMSPLHDFLKVTQKEISRVEIQLKKTPSGSPDRPRYEQVLTELVEQREFLADNLKRTAHEIDRKVARISEILGMEAMVLTPPPTPNKD